jgi:hypothetical protein
MGRDGEEASPAPLPGSAGARETNGPNPTPPDTLAGRTPAICPTSAGRFPLTSIGVKL